MSEVAPLRLELRTAEGVVFGHVLATPVRRFLAVLVDLAVVLFVVFLVATFASLVGLVLADLAGLVYALGAFAVWVGYGIVLEARWRGRTLGKALMSLRVLDARGRRLRLDQVILRNLLRVVDQMPALYLVGGAASVLSPRAQRLGDLVAGTVVAWEERERLARLPERDPAERYNSLREHPVQAKRLRQALTPAELRIACAALARRDELDPEARLAVFGAIAGRFRDLVAFPPGALEGIADERLVRNVVEVVTGE